MYAVVGCNKCGTLWLLSDPGETAQCPRCRKRHQTKNLKHFYESEDREAAREARAKMLAEKQDAGDAFESVDPVGAMEHQIDEREPDDAELLESAGLDPDEVAAAGDVSRSGSTSRDDIVRQAIRDQDAPTEDDVVEYAREHGVPGEAARDLLLKLTRRGEASESRGRYRLL